MLLLLHIFIAVGGLFAAAYTYIKPTNQKINVSYAFLTTTLASGVLLIVINNASILHTCVSGLTFTGIMYAGIAAAKQKLALN